MDRPRHRRSFDLRDAIFDHRLNGAVRLCSPIAQVACRLPRIDMRLSGTYRRVMSAVLLCRLRVNIRADLMRFVINFTLHTSHFKLI